jgi:hypothetical protein
MIMTKKELIELLIDIPDEFIVILASDGEGNGYSPLADYNMGLYIPDSAYSGEVITEGNLDGFEDKERDMAESCIVFWPTN